MASSSPLNPNANPFYYGLFYNSLGQQNHNYSLLPSTNQTTPFPLPAYYWLPKYYSSCYPFPLVNVAPAHPIIPFPVSSELVSHGDGSQRSSEARASCGGGKMSLPKKKDRRESPEKSGSGDRVVTGFPCDLKGLESSGKTTVMVKNIPNHFRRKDMIRVINRHCRSENRKEISDQFIKSEYDFLYLPMDFNKYWLEKKTSNLGYAFVNFTSVIAAWRFYKCFNKYDWNAHVNNKICEITLAKIQGREALEKNFYTKMFYCHSSNYLPLVLNPACDGTSSMRRGRNIGIRVPTTPRHQMVKCSSIREAASD